MNTFTTANQSEPVIAADASGNFVVVWDSNGQDGSGIGVFGQRYASSGLPLGSEFRVNTYTTNAQQVPSVAADSAGNFVVVWISDGQDGSAGGIFGQRFASSGAPLGAEFVVNNAFTASMQFQANVAADPSGNFVVVWSSYAQDGSSYGIAGRRYAASGLPVGPEFRVNTFTTLPQQAPSVAVDSAGNFVVVWESQLQDGSLMGVFGQRYAGSGAPLGPEFRVNTYTTSPQVPSDVAMDAAGNFVVTWLSAGQDGASGGIFAQRFAGTGVPMGLEFRVNTFTTDAQFAAAVAVDPAGDFIVAWESYLQDGSGGGVFGQRYAVSGSPLGSEFRVNTFTTSSQGRPGVAADTAGDFVIVWHGNAQDGSNFGVFGQRYSPIVPVELTQIGVE